LFTDSLSENVAVLEELIRGIPAPHRNSAKKSAVQIENAFTSLQRDYPKNAAVALGAAFAIFKIAERLVEQAKESGSGHENLIQLLS
jgi:hypothetical protein